MAEGTNPLLQQLHEKVYEVTKLAPKVVNAYQKSESNISSINEIHQKVRSQDKVTISDIEALRKLYPKSIADCQSQERAIREALQKIYELREIRSERARLARQSGHKDTVRRGALMKMLQTSAQSIPVFMPKSINEKAPALCGAVPADSSYVAKAGDMVAALTRGKDGDQNWILAEVVTYHPSSGKYELDDIDEEQKEKLSLSKRRVIPLPTRRANPATNPSALFPKDAPALYPQTTCFYKGVVSTIPETQSDEYEILFEDSSYPEGFSPALKVAQRYVLPHVHPMARQK